MSSEYKILARIPSKIYPAPDGGWSDFSHTLDNPYYPEMYYVQLLLNVVGEIHCRMCTLYEN